ncbi:MAG: hypothetical protein HYU99_10255 [Deltaproteobacteria bacterium]|nr:hypothetical protein [Deltaproteobacteria bacterium]
MCHRISLGLKKVVFDRRFEERPEEAPYNNGEPLDFEHPIGRISSTTSYGGPRSKYKVNEDSYFTGVTTNGALIAGVIDGAGGSLSGYLAGLYANEQLSDILMKGGGLFDAFMGAHNLVREKACGAYASAVVVQIDRLLNVMLAIKGDSKAMTFGKGPGPEGKIISEGTTRMENVVSERIEKGLLRPEDFYNHPEKHIITGAIGYGNGLPWQTAFRASPGDRIVLGSDGLWDVVSEYEILKMAKETSPSGFQMALFDLAYARNNAEAPFVIQMSPDHSIRAAPPRAADNITVQVVTVGA